MKQKQKSGFSLIEVLVAALLLAVVAIGGSAVLYHTGSIIQVQGNKRIATEYGISYMERLKAQEYSLSRSLAPADPVTLTEAVNGIPFVVTTDLVLHGEDPSDPDVGVLTNEYIEVDVTIQYGPSPDETITMNSTKVLL